MASIIDTLGELALSTRLMRLSEVTRADVTRIYKAHGVGFESKWFPVLYVLSVKSPMGVIELAHEIGYAHPSVIALVQEMEAAKWIKSAVDKTDGRKRMLTLTVMAKKKIDILAPLWEDMRKVASQIYNNGSSLLKAVEDAERALQTESYYDRFEKLAAKGKAGVKKRTAK